MPKESLTDYTQNGETWYFLDEKECPECGGALSSNGRVHACTGRYEHTDNDCDWWEPIEN